MHAVRVSGEMGQLGEFGTCYDIPDIAQLAVPSIRISLNASLHVSIPCLNYQIPEHVAI